MWRGMRGRRGIAQTISSVIMCAVVLTIGVSVWSVASSASSIMQSDYYDEVMESVENIKERFFIENIGLDNTSQPTLDIWVVNYGEIEITVDWIRVRGGGNISSNQLNTSISPGEMVKFNVTQSGVTYNRGLSISVEVRSTRGNKAFDSTRIP